MNVRGIAACPACATANPPIKGTFGSAGILRGCPCCGHHFLTSPTPTAGFYNDHYSGFRSDTVFARHVRGFVDTQLKPRLPTPASILDLGCGAGEFMFLAKEAGYHVRGLDGSEAAIKLCAQRGLDAAVGDFLDPDVANRYRGVDAVTLWDVIEHLEDPGAMLTQVSRVLRPGGILFLKAPSVERLSLELSCLLPRIGGAALSIPAHMQFFRRRSMTTLLRRSGFVELEWLPGQATRSPAAGGTLQRKLTRAAIGALRRASGDSNLLVFATKKPSY